MLENIQFISKNFTKEENGTLSTLNDCSALYVPFTAVVLSQHNTECEIAENEIIKYTEVLSRVSEGGSWWSARTAKQELVEIIFIHYWA